jgi:hypothetical protein
MTGPERARHSGLRRVLLISLPPLLLVVALVFALQRPATAEDGSPVTINFNHKAHVDAGAQCLFCHPGGLSGQVSGIPSSQKCVGCHQNIAVTSEAGQVEIEKLFSAWEAQEPLIWPRVPDLPDFVYFSHFPHINAGKNCERCHGDVSSMGMVVPAYRINMGFCLKSCHRHEEPDKREHLMSCVTCHQ